MNNDRGRVEKRPCSLETSLQMMEICYKLWDTMSSQQADERIGRSLVTHHLKAMKDGSKKARRLFPNLLKFIEDACSKSGH